MNNLPIGIFDSGLGGLTVVKEIKRLLPNENIVYLGDTARVPYGTRSKKTVERFAMEDTGFLLRKNVKCIVIACNTASAQAAKRVRESVGVPVIDVITATANTLINLAEGEKVGVIATRGTVRSEAYVKAIRIVNSRLEIFQQA